ncbi:hypothetical protein C3D14_17885 [Salmonella enterica]|nr:hypothetical protein [Salmonella enterica]EBD6593582.1 hypothetical protein [Salmonella enterica]EDD5452196.1 hypothetical protein [Salmonella enterica subsp. enterica serovar Paratyphi B]EDE4810753.1 hypothetical protein [Salmonella enterica subsp. enterica serovar Paratyphi B]
MIGATTGPERDLLIVSLQSLHRERVSSFNAVCTACSLSGENAPPMSLFGIDEVTDALRRLGALPIR